MKTVTRFKKESTIAENIYSYNPTYYNVVPEKHIYKSIYNVVSDSISYSNQVRSFDNKRFFPYIDQIESKDKLNQIITLTSLAYDSCANLISSITQYENENQGVEATKYLYNEFVSFGNWGIPNKLISTTDSTKYTGEPSYVRKSELQYNSYGNLTATILDPGKTKEVTKTYFYNVYGLIKKDSVSSDSLVSVVNQYDYDNKFRFVIKTTNPMGDISTVTYYPGTGNAHTIMGIDSTTTTYEYDGFGRLIKTITPLGHQITRTFSWDDGFEPPATPSYMILTNAPGKPLVWETFNGSGQKTFIMTLGINGYVKKEFIYDIAGRLGLEKGPHYTNDWQHTPYTSYTYDPFGRVTNINSNLSYTNITYDGRKTTYSYPGNKRREVTINALKDVISIKENQDNNLVTNYTYHSSGQVKQVTSAGTTVSITYNEYGNPVSVTNPNRDFIYFIQCLRTEDFLYRSQAGCIF